MLIFAMTFMTANPVFKVSAFLNSNISKNGASDGQSYYRTVIGNHA